jgi:dihydroxyacetone kinase-like protein
MEIGVGIHGEPGRRRVKLKEANGIAEEMVSAILSDFGSQSQGRTLLFINGFGGTPAMELYLMFHAAHALLKSRGLEVSRSLVGSYVTSLDMAGCSITVTLLDDETIRLWDAPVHTAALR